MKRLIYVLTAVSLIFLHISCKTKQKSNSTASTPVKVISMQKTACYGQCPVYTIDFYSDGSIIFNGEKFTEKTGRYENKIPLEELNQLIQRFYEIEFFNLEDEYTGDILDFPTTYLTFSKDGKEKKIKDYYGAPEELKQLENILDRYRNLENWVKID